MRRLSTYLHPLTTAILLAVGLPLCAQTLSRASNEYNKEFEGYTFNHTQGFPDTKHMMDWPEVYEDPDKWEFLTEGEKDRFNALGIDITLPDFSFMTSADSKYPLADGHVRQRTHTVEHILYAMPGDLVPMYPYYRMTDKDIPDYEDKFSHWYDFTSGGCLTYELDGRVYDMIDFLDDRQHMHRIEDVGFIGGETLNTIDNGWQRIPGTFANFYCPPTPDGKLPFNEEQKEFVIAADFSQTFSINQHIDKDNEVITEPLIAFRHIFRIRDARTFAEEFSGSVEKNRSYIDKHQKMVTAPAGKFFQMRLESPLPQDYRLGQSIYYFKRQDGTYGRVCGHDVRVFNGDTGEIINQHDFSVWDREDRRVAVKRGYAAQEADGSYYTGKDDPDFVNYVTMLYNSKAPIGHYIVQFLGKDKNDSLIKLTDADGNESDLVIMEYNVTFLNEEGASVVTEADLYGNDKFKHARDEQLKEDYGQPADVIDFDEYIKINQLSGKDKDLKEKLISYTKYRRNRDEEDGSWHYDSRIPDDAPFYIGKDDEPTENGKEHSFYKWPVSWSQSSYSFGYRYRHDYNMYMLATHSRVVPYKDAAATWTDNMDGDGTGLYDRLYYKTRRQNGDTDPTKVEQGYFYYVNAASDPGVSARLNITIPCPGSRIVVSAWIAEFSNAEETANISFNFVAVMKDTGERIVLHNFITGYVSSNLCGKWLNVYYSFVPRLAEFTAEEGNLFKLVDHYELELDNNTTSSAGADYAIDDIRAYVVPPMAEAEQLTFACDNDNIRLRLGAPFETLLEKTGKSETIGDSLGDDEDLYYTFIDKLKFDALYDNGKGNLNDAYDAAVVKKNINDGSVKTYGKVTFKTNYLKNEDFAEIKKIPANIVEDKAYRFTEESGERMIVFEHSVQLSNLRAGREYYVVFRSSLGAGDTPDAAGGEASFFNVADNCANKCVSVIRPANTIKVDGVIRKDIDRLIVCENQSPVIQVNIAGKFEDGSIKEVEKNAHFDWFAGTIDDFYSAKDDDGNSLRDALWVFRSHCPDSETVSGIKADAEGSTEKEPLLQWMLDIIKNYTMPTEEYPTGQLSLYRSSYVVPGVSIPADAAEARSNVVAIPIPDNGPDKEYILCTNPTELELKFANNTPILRHGLKGVVYPASLQDVPLRVGLEQLYADVNVSDGSRTLEIPVRLASSTNEKVGSLELKESAVVLVQTNDPEYRHIGTLGDDNKEIESLLWVGEISQLTASTAANADGNLFKASFDRNFRFKEGYFYRLRFNFEENKQQTAQPDEDAPVVCSGQDVFTLKIVPKYLLWRGGENLNFNNDANWMRVHTDTISAPTALAVANGRHRHFATNGANSNPGAYAPLDFTHVVLKSDVENPFLYKSTEQPSDNIGSETPLIRYDMAGYLADAAVKCKEWYPNTCKEIHFRPGATIMNQQELTYEKAWVDMELDHSRWYTVSSPLKEVYAGDFYLPTAGGRQMTELFQPITFDNELKLNDRFRPAVYQRGWDKASALVYELDAEDNEKGSPRDVAIKTFWSHVYNDVNEQYGGGTGFSIKTDVSEMSVNKPGVGDKVLFRLPKADEEYWYFKKDKSKDGHHTEIDRSDDHYRLNDGKGSIKASTATEGQYFLVGNPFMTHMDIADFLDENKEILEQKFWIITSDGQIAGTVGANGVLTTEPTEADADMSAIAPMQGFFVKTKKAAKNVELSYNPSMMRRYTSGDVKSVLTGTTRASEIPSMLRITACNDGVVASTAVIATESEGMQNVEAIDCRSLDLPSMVYTISAGQAQSINFCEDAEGMEIGVAADDGIETLIRFDGVDVLDGFSLLDKEAFSLTELYDGMEISLQGSAAGRFFLTRAGALEEVFGGIEWRVSGNRLEVYDRAATGSLELHVYDTLGRMVATEATGGDSLGVVLGTGVYVVEIANKLDRKSIKVRI